MKKFTLVGLALMIGCGAGMAARDFWRPAATAQPPAKQFQHFCTELKWDEVLGEQELRPEFGLEGWELATFVSAEQKRGLGGGHTYTRIIACFKRQI